CKPHVHTSKRRQPSLNGNQLSRHAGGVVKQDHGLELSQRKASCRHRLIIGPSLGLRGPGLMAGPTRESPAPLAHRIIWTRVKSAKSTIDGGPVGRGWPIVICPPERIRTLCIGVANRAMSKATQTPHGVVVSLRSD